MKSLLLLVLVAAVSAQQTLTLASYINDNYVLNYALSLENFEAELYRRAAASFTPASFASAGYNSSVYEYLMTLAAQEAVHSSAINATLIGRGWPPVQPCTYSFPSGVFTDVNTLLGFLSTVEQVGVSAYDGAVPYLSDPALLEFAATIATVEGRHSAFINAVLGTKSFSPAPLEPTLSPSQVVNTVAGFFGNCPTSSLATGYNGTVTANTSSLTLPVLANATRQLNPAIATANPPVVNISSPAKLNDDRVLNYALTALQFVDSFLNFSLNGNDTIPAPVTAASLAAAGYDPSILNGLRTILDQNTAQVAAVRRLLSTRGQTPVAPCVYTFPDIVTSVAAFWPLAVTFENVSVKAFDGGITAITDTTLSMAAATIATVEGRHSAFLNNASRLASAFPSPYDGTFTPTMTYAQLGPYIVTCPTTNVEAGSNLVITSLNLTLPTNLNYFGQNAQTISNSSPAGSLVVTPATPTSPTGTGAGTTTNPSTSTSNSRNWASPLAASFVVVVAAAMFV